MNSEEFDAYLTKKFPHTSSFWSGLGLCIVDAIVLFLCIGLGFFIVNLFAPSIINFKSFIVYSVYIPFILILFGCVGLYPGIMNMPTEEVKQYCGVTFFSICAIVFTLYVSSVKDMPYASYIVRDSKKYAISIALLISFPFATIFLPFVRHFAKRFFSNFSWWGVPAVIYTSESNADEVIDKLLRNKYLGYYPAVIIDSSATKSDLYNDIPRFSSKNAEILNIIKKHNIKCAIISDYKDDMSKIMSTYRYTISISKNQSNSTTTQQLKDIAGITGFASTHNLTFKSNFIIKRILDILIILFFCPILIPLMLILCILTKLTSKGPIFYGHKRVGKNGKEFKCWKFRSMCIDADQKLAKILAENPKMREQWEKERKFEDDPRVTKFGKFLRKTSLDELPQLFNVIIGQMALVGPRPVTEGELEKYGESKDYVLSVLPGITGMWQTSGRSKTVYEERILLDSYYIQNWSIWLDLWILIKTIWVVLDKKGAY